MQKWRETPLLASTKPSQMDNMYSFFMPLSVVVFLGFSPIKTDNTQILGYKVPNISGWRGTSFTKKDAAIHSATYTRKVEGNQLILKFVVVPEKTVLTFQDLQQTWNQVERSFRRMDASSKITNYKQTQYRGFNAISGTIFMQKPAKTEVNLLLANRGSDRIRFTNTIKGRDISPKARVTAEQGWNTLLSQLKLPQ